MQFLVLGPLEVITDGRTVALPAAKHRALLTALLVRVNQTVPAYSLIYSLWEGRPPASAAKTLQTYVSQLRREIEPASAASDWRTLLDQIGQAKGSSGELAEARRIAAGLGPDTVLERMLLYWSGEWERSEAAWTAAGDAMPGPATAWTASSMPTGWAGCDAFWPRTRRPRRRLLRASRWRRRGRRSPLR
jgi:hypothetical protein